MAAQPSTKYSDQEDPAIYFSGLSEGEKLICAVQASYYAPLDVYQFEWLLKKLCHRGAIASKFERDELQIILKDLTGREVMCETGNYYSISDDFFAEAFRYPISKGFHQVLAATLLNFTTDSEFAFLARFSAQEERELLTGIYTGTVMLQKHDDWSFLEDARPGLIPLELRVLEPFDESWFQLLPEAAQVFLMISAHRYQLLTFDELISEDGSDLFRYFRQPRWFKSDYFLQYGAHIMAEHLILQGQFDRARTYLESSTSPEAQGLHGLILFLFHGHSAALPAFRNALKNLRKDQGKKHASFLTIADPFYYIALLQEGSQESLHEARQHQERAEKISMLFRPFYWHLTDLYHARISGKINKNKAIERIKTSNCFMNVWLACFTLHWLGAADAESIGENLSAAIVNASGEGFMWPLCEGLLLKSRIGMPLSSNETQLVEDWKKRLLLPLAEMVEQRPPWEMVLEALSSTLNLAGSNSEADARVIWELKLSLPGNFRLQAREQTRLKSGRWSAGKLVDPARFFDGLKAYPDFYTQHDQNVFQAMRSLRPWLNGLNEDDWRVFPALIGHPQVFFINNSLQPLEILRGEPVLVLSENSEELQLVFQPEFKGQRVMVVQEADYRLRVYEFSETQVKTARILENHSKFPPAALTKLKTTIAGLSPLMPVHTSVEGTENLTPIASIAAHSNIYAQMAPSGEGLKFKFCVKPFGDKGPNFVPGRGMTDVFTEIAGQKLHTRRSLPEEIQNAELVINRCPSLEGLEKVDYCGEFVAADDALQLLLELQQIEGLCMEWPENHRPTKVSTARFTSFRFKISGKHDWFELDGELPVDDGQVIELQRLLKLYDGHSKFIAIGEDQFLAITEDFRRRINDLRGFTESGDDNSRFHSSALPAIETLLADLPEIDFDKRWHEALNRMKAAAEMTFAVPSTMTAELREYQREGFYWLCRMAYLGMGACLADDMGLGKTVEALALILSRASEGPAFVLAPTSVCMNWYNEARRFTPTLNPVLFGQSDRKTTIKKLAPYDLIICSYGVLQNEIDSLAEIDWATVVLDEAQAIKNMATNRSQAAMTLRGRFKMLMTGTPIENHLGELWNLFRFLNPGLLGSLDKFNEKYANPIQNFGDKQAQNRLKKLVQPFILRRTKSQVLQDLPPRTEITLQVDLSSEEAALYESMRRRALDRISSEEGSGSKPLLVLAEIMKLRRLCCNPSLVAPELQIPSSKLSLLESIVDELLDNRHKALIFSQFVDHLSLVRELLDKKNMAYQYLDGSTPVRARNKAIANFQAGNGDFFLISLKAGGLGLNLTAADYVIHLDPWWNPAVEDQASDRAHRIGQTRPVTIYRLITTNTIEEKIVQLHHRKRDLADGLLDGSDMAGRVSTNELLELISSAALNAG